MIELPPGSSPASSASTSTISVTPDVAKAIVLSKLDAVVQSVQARVETATQQAPAWDILLKLNPAAVNTPLTANSISPDVLRTLQQNQAVLLQTHASQPLPEGSRLQVNVSVANGVQIQQVQLPGNSLSPIITQLRQFIHQQQAVQPLLVNLLQLVQQSHTAQIDALPLRLQIAIRNLMQALPNPDQVRQEGQIKQWLQDSGLMQEAKLAQTVKPELTRPLSTAAGTGHSNPTPTKRNMDASSPVHQVRQQIQDWIQKLKADADEDNVLPRTQTQPASSPVSDSLNNVLAKDLKHLLQQLQTQLQQSQPTTAESGDDGAQPKPDSPLYPPGKTAVTPAAGASEENNPLHPARKLTADEQARVATQRHESTLSAATSKPALAIQRYQAEASASTKQASALDSADLIPPLPGQVVVQAQPRQRPSLRADDMADAIVKTLLAQVRGAIARTTLHQLSSHSSRQDSTAPTGLSFELPFLHHQQIEVFQFRIDEEDSATSDQSTKQQAKRWMVQMGFDIEGLGPMFCQLSLTGKSMAVQFWAAWEQTLSSTKAHFGFLEQALQEMGIRVEKIQAQLGMPELDKTGIRNQLVDIKT